jgi:maleate cis-trans isomerase
VLVPSGNVVTEPELALVAPPGVSWHCHRFYFSGGGDAVLDDIRRVANTIADAAAMIRHAEPSVIAMTGTAVSFFDGHGYDRALIDKIRERVGDLPVTTTSTSVLDALARLKVKRLSVAMPYIEEVARAAVRFLEGSGLEVLAAKWLDKRGFEIARVSGEELISLVEEVDRPESDALFISCTSLHTIEIIDELERRLNKPVVTSNQATFWNILRLAGIDDKIDGFGQLFRL